MNENPFADSGRDRGPSLLVTRMRGGFTLLELTVVLVVTGLLAVAAVPTYNRFVDSSHDAAASEVVREVLNQTQSLAASADRDAFHPGDLARAVKGLPDDMWQASGATEGLAAQSDGAVRFTAVTGGPSTDFGEVSIGVHAGGDTAEVSMRSRSGKCVSGTSGLRGAITVTVGAAAGTCAADHVDAADPATDVDLDAPPCPTGPTLTAADSEVALSWNPSAAADLAGYDLYIDGAEPPTPLGPSVSSHTVSGLANDQAYVFSIVAYDAAGNRSASCALGSATPSLVVPDAPDAPMLCTGGAPACVAGDGAVTVNWATNPADEYASFDVYRDGALVSTVPGTVRTLTDSGLTNGVTYLYWVIGVAPTGVPSPSSNVVPMTPEGTIPVGPASLAAPNVTATPAGRQIEVSWTASVEPEVVEYFVFLDGTRIATVPAASPRQLTVTETAGGSLLQWAGQYTITVVASNGAGLESPPGAANALLVPAVPSPTATLSTVSAIRVAWPAVTGANSYRVTTNTGAELASLTGLSWTHTGRPAGTTHIYRARACNATGCSELSAPTQVTTPSAPAAPAATCPARNAILPGDMSGCDKYRQLIVRWTAPANNGSAITSYQVRSGKTGGSWGAWVNVGIPPTAFGLFHARVGDAIVAGHNELTHPQAFKFVNGNSYAEYSMQVRACNAVGCGSPSATVTGRPFSNDLYPTNALITPSGETVRRGEHLQSVVNDTNTAFGIYFQARAAIQSNGNLVLWHRARSTTGVWGGWTAIYSSGISTSDTSAGMAVADSAAFSGLIIGGNNGLVWAGGGARCAGRANVRAFLFHNGSFAVYNESHHRRNYTTYGGNFPPVYPYNGTAQFNWMWAYSTVTDTASYNGCGGASGIVGGYVGSLPDP